MADILQKMLSFDDLLEACKRVHEYLCLNGDVDWEITKVVEAAIRQSNGANAMNDDELMTNDELRQYAKDIDVLNDKLNSENIRLRRAIGELCDANTNVIDFCRNRGVKVGVNGIVADLLKATETKP